MTPEGSFIDEAQCTREQLMALQQRKLRALFQLARERNPFYRAKLAHLDPEPEDLLSSLPFTTRDELEADQAAHPPFGSNLTFELDQYCRFHQTSGTHGRPMRWLDTAQSWGWFARCWQYIFEAAQISRQDRLFFPFSFGPFVGFWAAFESAAAAGFLCIPAGGLSTQSRLKMIADNGVTVVFCTPTYALHLADAAREMKLNLASLGVRALIVAGEPGGSIPTTRQRIESAWGARVFDHHGMTEIGPATFECAANPGTGLHLIESEFIAEMIDPLTGQAVPDGAVGELVLTNLGRLGSPLIRYRTRDQVRLTRGACVCGQTFARLEGGILGRFDDMFIVRGNNVFPTAVEAVLRSFPEVAEFRVNVRDDGPLAQVAVELEPTDPGLCVGLGDRVGRALQTALSFRAEVSVVEPGTLPRFEMKAHRFIRSRS